MNLKLEKKVALVTGAAGFVGFHVSLKLLNAGWKVIGLDCLSDYYDISLKKNRESKLLKFSKYKSIHSRIENDNILENLFANEMPDIVIHLAAQAGVRHSVDFPEQYVESNIVGTFKLLEASRKYPPKHLLLASTSSIYGANLNMPYKEIDKAEHQISFYAATKKSTENMAHSYSHLFKIPTTIFRFFTVYGPWGRPDMALFKFTEAILNRKEIEVYNYGNMERDFTYIDDLVERVFRLIDCVPNYETSENNNIPFDSKSPVAAFRVVNIGNSAPVKLLDFLNAIEIATGIKAKVKMMPLQIGDVPSTWANTDLIQSLTGKIKKTEVIKGVSNFVKWYRNYYIN